MNREKRNGNNTSKYKGVGFHSARKKWRARIKIEGEEISLGYWDNEIDAAKAYDRAAVIYFKEFACLNFK
jgi:hypothetical protein